MLDIGKLNSFDEDDYIVTSSNLEVIKWIEQWPEWGSGIYNNVTFITGENSAGKTHLTRIWSQKSKALYITKDSLLSQTYMENQSSNFVLEDLEQFDCEKELFHFLEYVITNKNFLIITSNVSPAELHFNLPDLRSRLNSFLVMKIKKPDSAMVEQILIKYFSDRQVSVSESVIKYLVSRVDFSYKKISEIVEKLDKSALEAHKNISVPFVKSILDL